jgi:hypothetical protein
MPLYPPQDSFPYAPDSLSRLADGSLPSGLYAYAQDESGNIWVVPDRPHVHPKILGLGRSVMYAGDLKIERGELIDVTNLSGTFQCDDPPGLLAVAAQLRRQGLRLQASSVRFFPADGSAPLVLE